MRRVSIFSGTAFRSALLFLLVFAMVLGVAGWVILDVTRGSMLEQTKSYIEEDVGLLRDAGTTGGERELTRFVDSAAATRSDKQFAFGLFEPSGVKVNCLIRPNSGRRPRHLPWRRVCRRGMEMLTFCRRP